jgi:hypothetical protein
MRPFHLFAIALTATCSAAAAGAQDLPSRYLHRASVNFLGIPFGIASAEYEGMTSDEVSLGAGAGVDTDNYAWGEGKLRYYPGARAPRGFAIGMSAGAARVNSYTEDDCFIFCSDASGPSGTGATVGVFLDYSWLLGRSRRFYVGTGLGLKRVFGLDDAPGQSYPEVLGASRLQVGYAF